MTPGRLLALSEWCWWIHLVDILFFGNYLPYSKHFHIITSIPNIFFMKLEPMGKLATVDLENTERFGASRVEDLTWKQMLDGYTCTECGRCRAWSARPRSPPSRSTRRCSSATSGTPSTRRRRRCWRQTRPRKRQRRRAFSRPPGPRGRMDHRGDVWACTTCGGCDGVPGAHLRTSTRSSRCAATSSSTRRSSRRRSRALPRHGDQRQPVEPIGGLAGDWTDGLPMVTMAEAEKRPPSSTGWAAPPATTTARSTSRAPSSTS